VPMKTAICAVSAFVLREFCVQWHRQASAHSFKFPSPFNLDGALAVTGRNAVRATSNTSSFAILGLHLMSIEKGPAVELNRIHRERTKSAGVDPAQFQRKLAPVSTGFIHLTYCYTAKEY
jgi:hypothetical protein